MHNFKISLKKQRRSDFDLSYTMDALWRFEEENANEENSD